MNHTILGKGAWGEAMGLALQERGHDVKWLDKGEHKIPSSTNIVWIALPTQAVRECFEKSEGLPSEVPVVSLSKGIEISTGKRVSEIVANFCPKSKIAAVSGPSLAGEILKKVPTALVAASSDDELARVVQQALHGPSLRVYRSQDLIGVEWGGALKNVYALAAGMCAGLGLGENSLAGLTTRSLREMTRVAVHFGAEEETVQGLSGVGDLILTSYSRSSRNRRVGERLGVGDSLTQALASVDGVCEGVPTTEALHKILLAQKIDAPIAQQLFQVLQGKKSPKEGLLALLDRGSKSETE
jgi:glycerol-3-phosphate dehydrogenase (NAD(P)+)